jgi:hypothetical protein
VNFDLANNFTDTLATKPPVYPKRRALKLFEGATRHEFQSLFRRPTSLFRSSSLEVSGPSNDRCVAVGTNQGCHARLRRGVSLADVLVVGDALGQQVQIPPGGFSEHAADVAGVDGEVSGTVRPRMGIMMCWAAYRSLSRGNRLRGMR